MRLPLVPLFASDLGATTVQVGMINAGFMVAAALLSLPLGLVSDRLGRKRLILSGMAISGLTSLFLLLVRTPLQVGAVYLFAGVGLACFSPSMMSYVGDVSPPHFLGRAYGWYTSSLYLGMAAGPSSPAGRRPSSPHTPGARCSRSFPSMLATRGSPSPTPASSSPARPPPTRRSASRSGTWRPGRGR